MGECHYLEGNEKALARSAVVKIVLAESGIDPERFAIEWVSSAEAPRFAEIVTRFTEKIKALGPNMATHASTRPEMIASRQPQPNEERI
jgi:F420-non-reducing hydrogenase iron-sulfur subunit